MKRNESGKMSIATLFFVLLIIIIIVLLLSMVKLMVENKNYKQEIINLNDTIQTIESKLTDTESKLESVANIIGNDKGEIDTDSNTFSSEELTNNQ